MNGWKSKQRNHPRERNDRFRPKAVIQFKKIYKYFDVQP